MKFAIMASGSKGNSFVLSDRGVNILIDGGSSQRYIRNSLDALDIAVEDLNSVLITHAHTGHVHAINLVKDRPIYSACEIENIDTIHFEQNEEFLLNICQSYPLD